MSVPWWLQTILSALRNQNQTRIKMNKHPHPQSQESSKKECRKSYRAHWSQGHSMALLIWRCLQLCYLSPASIWCLWPDRNPDTAKLPTNLCLNTTSFPSFPSPGLESVSSMKEALFVTAGKAWHRVSWILISRPLKPLCVHPRNVEVGV